MGRKFKISEEQYNKALSEGVTLTADVDACNGDVNQAVQKTRQKAKESGVDLSQATISVPGQSSNESKLITKKELKENRLKVLKANSRLFSVRDFVKKIK
jgi:mannitol-specific phosphotransferase system IIBC component